MILYMNRLLNVANNAVCDAQDDAINKCMAYRSQ